MSISHILSVIQSDMQKVDTVIRQRLNSDVVMIRTIGEYIISAGGKRIRPALVLLVANALQYQGTNQHLLAAIVEFIHTSTLLHDDVVDESDMRRGRQTANAVFGNAASVLVGDYLYSRSFEMMVEVDLMRIMQIMSQATTTIAEGEVLQLLNIHDPDIDEKNYLQVIHCKTAKLFEASAQVAAVIAQADSQIEQAAAAYGRHLGAAFQLMDDVLDYTGDSATLGKTVGDDLREGKPTMPVIYALQQANEADRQLLRTAIEKGEGNLNEVVRIIETTKGLQYTQELAQNESNLAQKALEQFPDSVYKRAMLDLAQFVVSRNF